MKLKLVSTLCLLLALFAFPAAFANEGVAKAIIVKGKVTALLKNGKTIDVIKDTWLPEGAKVSTAASSFAKLLFIDKSSMNVGPSSAMEIASFPKSEPGVINLIQGEVRSKVTKNYMDMKDKDKSKLFIKTKTAAMGVRGTDFIVGYQASSGATSLDVVSGTVAMAAIDPSLNVDQRALEAAVSSPSAVMVEKGFTSEVGGGSSKATPPTPIPPSKLENLKSNENALVQSTPTASNDRSETKTESKGDTKDDKGKSETAKAENKTTNDTDKKDKKPDAAPAAVTKSDAPKTEAPKAPAAPTAPATGVLPPGLSANMAINSAPSGTTGDDPNRAPASVNVLSPTAPPPVNVYSPPPPPPVVIEVQAPQCKDLCQCYGIGCTVAAAGSTGGTVSSGGNVGSLDGNTLGTISNQIQSNITDAIGSGQLPATATVQFNITTQ